LWRTPEEAQAALDAASGSLIKAARALKRDGHSLEPIVDDPKRSGELLTAFGNVADPERPVGADTFVTKMFGGYLPTRHVGTVVKVIAAGLLVLGIALAWQFVPLADPKTVKAAFTAIAESRAAPVLVVGVFVVGGLVSFPVTVLIGASAAVFGPVTGFCYAAAGALTSALVTYGVGAALGKRTLLDVLGPTLNRLRQRVAKRGVVTVAAVRLVPVAPFTVVNLVAGASGIPVFDYVAGTLIGMLPGLVMISAVGHQLARVFTAPSAGDLALLAVVVAAWITLSLGVQAAVSRYWRSGS
jgi:phospholipase D1/2